VLTVRLERDLAVLPADGGRGGWQRRDLTDRAAWLVFDDRGLYRPGEQVHLKGWLRTLTGGPAGDVAPAPDWLEEVTWTAWDALDNEIASGSARVDGLGGFDLTVDLPGTVNLGDARVELVAPEIRLWRHEFRIAEFRRPEYEVSASIEPDRAIAGETVTASARAAYYAGGPLRVAPVDWSVTATPARYSPPGWGRFTFGTAMSWWRWDPWADDDANEVDASFEGVTGDDGSHRLGISTAPGSEPRPWSVSAEATVEDVNRKAWTASVSVVVHPSALCVGLRSHRSFVTGGRPFEIETVVVDLDGAVLPGIPVSVRAERREHRQVAGQWREVVAETVERTAVSGTDAVRGTRRRRPHRATARHRCLPHPAHPGGGCLHTRGRRACRAGRGRRAAGCDGGCHPARLRLRQRASSRAAGCPDAGRGHHAAGAWPAAGRGNRAGPCGARGRWCARCGRGGHRDRGGRSRAGRRGVHEPRPTRRVLPAARRRCGDDPVAAAGAARTARRARGVRRGGTGR
jgi:hypothetical protein